MVDNGLVLEKPSNSLDELESAVHDLGNYIQIARSGINILSRHSNIASDESLQAVISYALDALDQAGSLVRLTGTTGNTPAYEKIDLNQCLEQIAPMLRYTCGPAIKLSLLLQQVPKVCCSRLDLQNALLNIVLNAKEAMPRGGALGISTQLVSGSVAPEVELIVCDTGVGMPPEVLQHAFDAHFSTKVAGKGHGMGLAGVKRFIERIGGQVFIESQEDYGTEVILRLPITVQR